MNIEQLNPNDVEIPSGRFRDAEPKDIEEMAISLGVYGQLQPIGVSPTGQLVYGLHRLLAARKLGWPAIAAIRKSSLTELEHREQELEENIRRKQMKPVEIVQATAEIHKLKIAANPNWTMAQTAVVAKLPRGKVDVSEHVKMAKMIELFPELAEAKSVSQLKSWAEAKAALVNRTIAVQEQPDVYGSIAERIWLGDSVELIKTIADNSFDAVITDPPFGLDYDDRKSGTEGALSSYKDDKQAYERLLSMAPDIYRVVKPNGWLVWFFGISWYERVKAVFREAGFTVDEIPIIWDRSGGRCHTNRPDRYFARAYDVAIHCIKGNPQIPGKRGLPNVIHVDPVPTEERDALVERPVELYAELIRRLTIPGETVADFFVGSGSCPAAAASTGRNYFGCELSSERRAIALKKIQAYTKQGVAV